MQINIRINGVLAQKMNITRFPVTLPPEATTQDLVAQLQRQHPQLAAEFGQAVTVSKGSHLTATTALHDGQEVAVLLPIAGG